MVMSRQAKEVYEFGPFRIDVAERLLTREGQNVPLTPKAFDTLLLLVQNRGHLLEKDELMQQLWPNTFVEEANLTNNISLLRKALGDDAGEHRYIETVPKRGYRFGASVREYTAESSELIVERRTRASLTIEEESDSHDAVVSDAIAPRVTTATREATSVTARKILRRTAIFIIAAIIVGAGFWLYRTLSPIKPKTPAVRPFQNTKLTKLTGTGKVTNVTISPDGKYVAYAMNDVGGQSLWLRQVSTSSNIRIVPPVEGIYWGLTFSPDGEYIYYVTFEGNKGDTTLYKIPVLGGVATKLPNAPDSAITFSPDGDSFAYIHASSTAGRSALMTANADGGDKRTITERTQPEFFRPYPFAPAWSPDGKVILCAARSSKNEYGVRLASVRVENGSEATISDQPWNYIRRLAWLSDCSGVVMTARAESSAYSQIWLVDYSSGEATPITNDFSEYSSLGLTADSDQLVALQTTERFGLWVASNNKIENQRQIASESGELSYFCWTLGNRVVYRSIASGAPGAWIMNSDGTNKRQLATLGPGEKGFSVSRDGSHIVFASNRTGRFNIWRMDMDGANLMQLTAGDGEVFPQCSPDGRWVVYQSGVGNVPSTLWRVAIDGGDPVQLTTTYSMTPSISPDGSFIAYFYMDKQHPDSPWRIGIVSFADGAFVNSVEIPRTSISRYVRWTPDGKALAYIADEGEVANIWVKPLDGGLPKKLTNFEADIVVAFDWSPDGKQILISRGTKTSDAVIISDLK
jgi:Tol biopolymer transport system component/DNA-binding winged helix-turn-helix (wHTH) protein